MISFAQVVALIVVALFGGVFIAAARAAGDRWVRKQRRPADNWSDDDLETEWKPRSGGEEDFEFQAGSVNLKWRRKQ